LPLLVVVLGESKTGKTLLIENLVSYLSSKGIRVLTCKHTHHFIETLDTPSKDSWRHRKAGSTATLIYSTGESALFFDTPSLGLSFRELLEKIVEIVKPKVVILEGFSSLLNELKDAYVIITARTPSEINDEMINIHKDKLLGVGVLSYEKKHSPTVPIYNIFEESHVIAEKITRMIS